MQEKQGWDWDRVFSSVIAALLIAGISFLAGKNNADIRTQTQLVTQLDYISKQLETQGTSIKELDARIRIIENKLPLIDDARARK